MIKFKYLSNCIMCAVISHHIMPLNRHYRTSVKCFLNLKLIISKSDKPIPYNAKKESYQQILESVGLEKINSVKRILEKYGIDANNTNKDPRIFLLSPWTLEQRIMLLQEFGASKITSNQIIHFIRIMYMPVNIYKAIFAIDPQVNLAEKLFSFTNYQINDKILTDLNENMEMKMYYSKCLVQLLIHELDLNEEEIMRVTYKKKTPTMYNSFRLLQKLFEILKNKLNFNKTKIIKNRWLLIHHPKYVEEILNVITNNLNNVSCEVVLKSPKILCQDINNLQKLISYLKEYDIPSDVIQSSHYIFLLDSNEFKKRIDHLLTIPYTLIFRKHPKFLKLVRDYYVILPRIRYLEENNLKFATIYTLTSFNNYIEQLVSAKKLFRPNLKYFCQAMFPNNSEKLMQNILKHPCYAFVPLLQMYETISYLNKIYSEDCIQKNVYAILYHKNDLYAAREILLSHSCYNKLPDHQFLALCVYKIEELNHFTGEGVLTPEKFYESIKSSINSEKNENIKV